MFEGTDSVFINLDNSFKHFLQIHQNLPLQDSYCDDRYFDNVNKA